MINNHKQTKSHLLHIQNSAPIYTPLTDTDIQTCQSATKLSRILIYPKSKQTNKHKRTLGMTGRMIVQGNF